MQELICNKRTALYAKIMVNAKKEPCIRGTWTPGARGKKGGLPQAAALTPEERTESARKTAAARIKGQSAKRRVEIARQAAAKRWAQKKPSQ